MHVSFSFSLMMVLLLSAPKSIFDCSQLNVDLEKIKYYLIGDNFDFCHLLIFIGHSDSHSCFEGFCLPVLFT
jgi:hypothetical protein